MKLSIAMLVLLSSTISACGQSPEEIENILNSYLTKKYLKEHTLGLIVADGNSLTVGEAAGVSYVDLLKQNGWNAVSVASSDKSCETMATEAAEVVEPIKEKFDAAEKTASDEAKASEAKKNAESGTTVLEDETETSDPAPSMSIVWEGLNSFKEGKTPDEAYESLKEYITARKDKGWKTMVVSMMYTVNQELFYQQHIGPWRDQFNTLVLENSAEADYVLDLQKDFRLADPAVTTYFQADRLHLTKIGMRALAEDVQAEIVANGYVAPGK